MTKGKINKYTLIFTFFLFASFICLAQGQNNGPQRAETSQLKNKLESKKSNLGSNKEGNNSPRSENSGRSNSTSVNKSGGGGSPKVGSVQRQNNNSRSVGKVSVQPNNGPKPGGSVAKPNGNTNPGGGPVARPNNGAKPSVGSVSRPNNGPKPGGGPVAKPAPGPKPGGGPVAKPAPGPKPGGGPVAKPAPGPKPGGGPVAKPAPGPKPGGGPVAKPAPGPKPGGPVAKPAPGHRPGGPMSKPGHMAHHGPRFGPHNPYRPNARRPHNHFRAANYRPPHPHGGLWNPPPPNRLRPTFVTPMPPVVTIVRYDIPRFNVILSTSFGSFIDTSINQLYQGGYNVIGYADNTVYLENVKELGQNWEETAVYYTDGLLSDVQFQNWTSYPSDSRYSTIYSEIVNIYGTPAESFNEDGIITTNWWAGEDSGFITLQYGPSYSDSGDLNYYTTLTYSSV